MCRRQEEYGPPSTKSSESEEGEDEEIEKSTPSSENATEAQKTKNVARGRRSVLERGDHEKGKAKYIDRCRSSVVAKGEAKFLANGGVHGGMRGSGGGGAVGKASKNSRKAQRTQKSVGTPSGATMSVGTQWRQEQQRSLEAKQRWKQEQRRLLEALLGDAGLRQLLPKFIEEAVGYETIILPNFGRDGRDGGIRDETM